MPNSKLVAIVTALLFLLPSQHVRAEITLEHLLTIDQFLSENNIQALWDYLQKNPDLLLGDDELSLELRSFFETVSRGQVDYGFAGNAANSAEVSQVGSAALAASSQH